MLLSIDDTIAAIASAPGGAFRGIIRISGPKCLECVERCFEPAETDSPLRLVQRPSVLAGRIHLRELETSLRADLYLWPGTRSYTRQPSAELHTIGSPPLLEVALTEICRHGARIAQPGEFTLRAFLAGRLDLTQAEAVLGVIDAHSDLQLRTALSQLAGGLAAPLGVLRNRLLDLLAHLEAGLDFVDEEIEFISRDDLLAELDQAVRQMEKLSAQMQSRGESSAAPRVVLYGLPNAGKSSLLNALAGEDAALVSSAAGTTRDFVSRRVRFEQIELELVDTAGLKNSRQTEIAQEAQRMAREQAENCALRVRCIDATIDTYAGNDEVPEVPQIVVLTKCDLLGADARLFVAALRTSSRTGEGISDLRRRIAAALASQSGDAVASTTARCRESLALAADSLRRAGGATEEGLGEELVAAEVRAALDDLGRVVGAVYTEDILDRVFSRFCIGK